MASILKLIDIRDSFGGFMKKNFLYLVVLTGLTAISFSCAKKPSGVRTLRQTEQRIVDPNVTNASRNQAANQNVNYTMSVVEVPEPGSQPEELIINSEIKTPNGKFIPITTTHISGKDVYGILTDSDNGNKLDIRARCIGTSCEQYILLMTVVKNNYAVHQIVVVSYSHQSYFNLKEINYTTGIQFYQSLDAVQTAFGQLYK